MTKSSVNWGDDKGTMSGSKNMVNKNTSKNNIFSFYSWVFRIMFDSWNQKIQHYLMVLSICRKNIMTIIL